MPANGFETSVPPHARTKGRLPVVLGSCGIVGALAGYAMEWFRQRGTCDVGDPSPDTLVLSVLLIVIGGTVFGLVGLGIALYRWRTRHVMRAVDLVACMASVLGGASIFLFAGSGPGDWFQYCAT